MQRPQTKLPKLPPPLEPTFFAFWADLRTPPGMIPPIHVDTAGPLARATLRTWKEKTWTEIGGFFTHVNPSWASLDAPPPDRPELGVRLHIAAPYPSPTMFTRTYDLIRALLRYLNPSLDLFTGRPSLDIIAEPLSFKAELNATADRMLRMGREIQRSWSDPSELGLDVFGSYRVWQPEQDAFVTIRGQTA